MLKYQIALINVFWSEGDINTRFFETLTLQNSYFDRLTNGNFSPLVNFNMGNNVETSVIYRDESNRSVSELTKCNYAVIHLLDDESGDIIERRYFFAYPYQDSGRQMRVTLSLDDIQTNYYKYKDTISPCIINRACLNRWTQRTSELVEFDGRTQSKMFKDEPYGNSSKRLIRRRKLSFNTFFTQSEINTWLDDNVLSWVYIFVDPNHEYERFNNDPQPIKFQETQIVPVSSTQGISNTNISTQFTILCYPILKGNKNLIIKKTFSGSGDKLYYVNKNGLFYFQQYNNDSSYIYDIQMSNVPPFAIKSDGSTQSVTYSINSNGDLILQNNSNLSGGIYNFNAQEFTTSSTDTNPPALAVLYNIPTEVESKAISIDDTFTNIYDPVEIANLPMTYQYNPKAFSENFFELKLENESGDGFVYDIQKLNLSTFTVLLTSPIVPGFTKSYLRIKTQGGIYIPETSKNFTGSVLTDDLSITRVTSAYAQMLANNKNYFQQQNTSSWFGTLKSILGGVIGGVALGGVPGGLVGGFTGLGNGLMGVAENKINMSYSLDNMKSAPSSIQEAKGNMFLYLSTTAPGFYVSEYQSLPADLKSATDYNYLYGYTCKEKGFIGDYDNIRISFNYVSADVENIQAPISNLEKNRLRDKLKSIRFLNSDNVTFNNNNMERSFL